MGSVLRFPEVAQEDLPDCVSRSSESTEITLTLPSSEKATIEYINCPFSQVF